MSYSIKDLTVSPQLACIGHTPQNEESMSLDQLAFWQAVNNLCSAFKQNHMGARGLGRDQNYVLGSDMSLVFVGWVDEIKFIRFRDRIGALATSRSSDPRVSLNYIKTTLEIIMCELDAIQKLVLLDSLWSLVYGGIGSLKPVISRTNLTGFMPFIPLSITIDKIKEGVGTAAFAKDYPSLSTLFTTYNMVKPIIQKKYPELIEAVDITLEQLVVCEGMLPAYTAVVDLLEKLEPFHAKSPANSVSRIYKLDCDCHLDDYDLVTEMMKFCLVNLYSVEL